MISKRINSLILLWTMMIVLQGSLSVLGFSSSCLRSNHNENYLFHGIEQSKPRSGTASFSTLSWILAPTKLTFALHAARSDSKLYFRDDKGHVDFEDLQISSILPQEPCVPVDTTTTALLTPQVSSSSTASTPRSVPLLSPSLMLPARHYPATSSRGRNLTITSTTPMKVNVEELEIFIGRIFMVAAVALLSVELETGDSMQEQILAFLSSVHGIAFYV